MAFAPSRARPPPWNRPIPSAPDESQRREHAAPVKPFQALRSADSNAAFDWSLSSVNARSGGWRRPGAPLGGRPPRNAVRGTHRRERIVTSSRGLKLNLQNGGRLVCLPDRLPRLRCGVGLAGCETLEKVQLEKKQGVRHRDVAGELFPRLFKRRTQCCIGDLRVRDPTRVRHEKRLQRGETAGADADYTRHSAPDSRRHCSSSRTPHLRHLRRPRRRSRPERRWTRRPSPQRQNGRRLFDLFPSFSSTLPSFRLHT